MATNNVEAVLAAELRARHGVTTRARLRKRGLTDRVITSQLRRGRLVSVGRGVLVDPGSPDTFERKVAIACALTGGVASYPTAGVLWRYRKTPNTNVIHVMTAWPSRPRPVPDVVVHASTDLRDTDIVRRRDGIALTCPPLTAFTAASVLGADELESLIEQGLDRENFTIPTLWAFARRLCRNGRDGSTAFAQVLQSRPSWVRPVNSNHELRLARALQRRGFPTLARQCRLEIMPGVIVHPDLGIPEDRFYIEVDHVTWHGGRVDTVYDKWRDRKVRRRGCQVERVTDVAIDEQLDDTVEDLWELWQAFRAR